MYKEKFGEARVKQMMPRMKQVFADVGLEYSLEGLTGNTLNSHRLVSYWLPVTNAAPPPQPPP